MAYNNMLLSYLFLYGFFYLRAFAIEIIGISVDPSSQNQSYKPGSISGGTTLHIRGEFSSDDLQSLKVYVGLGICDIVEFYSTMNYIQCVTPAASSFNGEIAPISIEYDGIPAPYSSSVNLNFTYTKDNTPEVLFINPSEASPGDEVSFIGRWMTTVWTYFDSSKVGKKQMQMYLLGEGYSFG